ncbi:MAG: glycoside hydrolase family 2 protein [Candidatus Izemoplasmataceae bacterium]
MIKTALNFNWHYKRGFNEEDILGFTGENVCLPHTNQEIPFSYFSEAIYQFTQTYQKAFTYHLKKDRRLFITFEGVMTKAWVYLNGQLLGNHTGGYTAFTFELTNFLVDHENLLTIRVDSQETSDHPPFGNVVDYLTYGGLYREVFLIETALDTFETIHVHGDQSTLFINPYINALTKNIHTIKYDIYDKEDCVKSYSFESSFHDLKAITLNHTLTLWTLKHPKLYTLKVFVDEELAYETPFGLRTIRVDHAAFYLNDEPIFLRGLNRHQSYPYVGYAMPKSAQVEDADFLKYTLGVNIVRSSHYPPSKHFLDRCDAIGLMVFTELPGWQHIGDDTWKNHALNDLKSMVMHDYNHPSIVMIGTRINESSDDHDFYTKTQALVKSIDQTRPTAGVRFTKNSELLEDIYTFNDFYHRGFNKGLQPKKKNTKKINPYLITEHNGHMFPTKSFDHEQKRVEHALRHFNVLNEAYKQKGVMGAIGWCMADYNTHKDFGSNDHICHHGVSDMFRNMKYAASVYASLGEAPYLEVLSMMHIGELSSGELKEVLVATNLDEVKLYKNDTLIGTYSKKDSPYKNLPHPPIIIKDFIGDLIKDHESFTPIDAKRVKHILLVTLNNNLKMRFSHKIKLAYILFKYKMTYQDAIKLYTKYIGGWGESHQVYRFEGYKDNQLCITKYKGFNDEYNLKVRLSKKRLVIDTTYDTLKVDILLSNAYDELAYYTKETITISCNEVIEIIGPKHLALLGGIASFYVKSKQPGKAHLTISSERFETISKTFMVE